ncbi:peroxisomal 2,4-dienoyl-CoA reductase [Kwoniella mangroviensis CBS 10435]|uniref:2,4-dienoyl-CoA reductase [(3E)-enoyl-CoA-producing] n=1 Tax=Kwoniella mangroviensis CBS 10435 TaxID=1331196 RepID=A0A1B9J063_9TREE|nr:peroxisomal 2,4-dienoyl-CoA reductase [Kwoniella mangroviensis CBS 8507]OCF61167.1 peroxisomal 2,4-dienoyl-CoA reductase [Kwoniella mangroviensis CBS 10435]OCF66766.1 peroxisomal 2,4-dienoyl-CoA reductase [Kwoniella mangroviensis CBS 8507]
MSAYKPQVSNSKYTFKHDLFKGKVLFCTGGRSGICYKIVETMMSHGVDAAIVGRDVKGLAESAEALEKSTGQRCLPASADVRDPKQMEKAVKDTVDKYGKIDFVICGDTDCMISSSLAPITSLSSNAFKAVVDIDLLGTYNTIKATLPYVRESHGSYLHISATLHYRGLPYQAHVSAAKAGVDALSNVLAVEEGPRGVRSNVIAPGPIGNTEGMSRLTPKGWQAQNDIPLGRMGDTSDIANAALFLFSPAANWITGTVLAVDGGENHIRQLSLPYPQSLLDPDSVKGLIKGKL